MLGSALFLAATVSTMCQTADVQVFTNLTDRRIVGCGEGFPDNVLWNLDRADSVDGSLDGKLNRTTTGRGAVIYILDTGVLRDHTEFERATGSTVIDGYEIGGYPTLCPEPVLSPCFESFPELLIFTHGTSVASVAAGKTVGIAPDAQLVAIRVGYPENNWVKALEKVIEHAFAPTTPQFRTGIINISGGVTLKGPIPKFEALMRRMIGGVNERGESDPNGKRFLFVTAAGNSLEPLTPGADRGQCDPHGNVQLQPGSLGTSIDGLITVGGLTKANEVWSGACAGPLVEVLAPAEGVLVASISGKDAYRGLPVEFTSGTSYSTPYVSGLAARMLELDPALTPAELERRLKASPSRAAGLPVPVAPVVTKRRASR